MAKSPVAILFNTLGTEISSAIVSGLTRLRVDVSWLGSAAPTVGQKAMVDSIPVVLASDQPATPSGIQGEVDMDRVFSVATEVNMAAGGTDNPLILLRNPALSGKTLYLVRVQAGNSVANVAAVFKVYHTPTITLNGTVVTPQNRKIGSVVPSAILANTLPTIAVLGTKVSSLANGQNTNSVVFDEEYSVAVPEGKTILLTGSPLSNNRQAVLTMVWVEK